MEAHEIVVGRVALLGRQSAVVTSRSQSGPERTVYNMRRGSEVGTDNGITRER